VTRSFLVALLLDVVGAAVILLVATRTWQTVTVLRPGQPAIVDDIRGRTLDAGPTGLAVAALAAVVAVVATRGLLRRLVGLALAALGVVAVWLSVDASLRLSVSRARALVAQAHPGSALGSLHVATHSAWALASALGGLLIAAAGSFVMWRGHRWLAMSTRYEAPAADDETARARRDVSMWNALDRGDDPTS
jgi:uncharacterized membrane protein (TIGR02234 family)